MQTSIPVYNKRNSAFVGYVSQEFWVRTTATIQVYRDKELNCLKYSFYKCNLKTTVLPEVKEPSNLESSGGKVNYYLANVTHPTRSGMPAYVAEFEDISQALQLKPWEYNIMKEIWRSANARIGSGKAGNTPYRAAQKIKNYADLIFDEAEREKSND